MKIQLHKLGKDRNLISITKASLPTASLEISFLGGSSHESSHKNGTATLARRTILRGSKNLPDTNQLNFEIEKIGAFIASQSGKEFSLFNITVPRENFFKASKILSDLLNNPILRKADLVKEKQLLISQLREIENDPQELALLEFSKQMYKSTPYENLALGKEDDIKRINIEDIKRFISQYSRTTISIASFKSLSSAQLQLLSKDFNIAKSSKEQKAKLRKQKIFGDTEYFNYKKKDLMQTVFVIGGLAPGYKSCDYYTYLLLRTILGSGFGGLSHQIIREKLKLAYYSYSFFYPQMYFGIGGIISGVLKERKVLATKAVLKILQRVKENKLSTQETRRAKGFLTGILSSYHESSYEIAHFWGSEFASKGKILTIPQIIRRVRLIKREDIVSCARKYFEKVFTTLISDTNEFNDQILELIKNYNEGKSI